MNITLNYPPFSGTHNNTEIEPPPITEPSNLIFPTVFKPYFQIRLLNKDLQMISFIDSFEYFIWERSWRDLDKFTFFVC